VKEFFASTQLTVLKHPPYSPDLAPNEFFIFPKIKEILKRKHFDDIDDIRSNTTMYLKIILQNQFQNCSERWTRRWHICMAFERE
jgi:transposase